MTLARRPSRNGKSTSSVSGTAAARGPAMIREVGGPGVIILDRGARITAASASAKEILGSTMVLDARGGAARVASPTLKVALQRLVTEAREPGRGKDNAKKVALLARPGRTPLIMMAAPVTETVHLKGSLVVLLHDPDNPSVPTAALLNQVYGLTNAETAIAIGLLEGHPLREIARHRGTSVNTARTLLYQAFAKLGVQRQADLVRLLAPLSSMQSLSIGLISAIQAGAVTFDCGRRLTDETSSPIRIDARRTAELEMSIMHSAFAPHGSTSKHFATGHELVYVREGTMGMEMAGQDLRIAKAGEIVHVGPGVVHRAFNASDTTLLKVIVMHLKDKTAVHRINVG